MSIAQMHKQATLEQTVIWRIANSHRDECARKIKQLRRQLSLARKALKEMEADGHCLVCGCEIEEGVTHECPPGFLEEADRG